MSRRRFLVAYDIREPKRLRAVHATMKAFGYPIQYSVFVCDLDSSEKLMLREALGRVVHQGRDSVVLVDLGDARSRGVECFEFMGPSPPLPKFGARVL